MSRYLLAIAFVLGPIVGAGLGQYIRIKVDFNKLNDIGKQSNNTGGGPGNPGGGDPAGGGDPGGGGPAGGGPAGGPGFPGGNSGSKKDDGPPPIWLEAWLPISTGKLHPTRTKTKFFEIKHRWGKSLVAEDLLTPINEKSLKQRYQDKLRRMPDSKKNSSNLFSLAKWTLEHGMVDEFVSAMKDLHKRAPKHPAGLKFDRVYKAMQARPEGNDPGAESIVKSLREKGYSAYTSDDGHYLLLTKLRRMDLSAISKDEKDAVGRRLDQLENSYQKFYYWFAMKGIVLPQPGYRLVAVLEETAGEFKSQQNYYTSEPMLRDSFTARQDNVIFLSASPTDRNFNLLRRNFSQHGVNYSAGYVNLLKGNWKGVTVKSWEDLSKLSTMALLQKAIEIDSERAATTHEAIRQLLISSDFLPRNVTTAEWLRYGLASFFATPRHSLYESTAMPGAKNLMRFRYLRETKKLPDETAGITLLRVITDRYFRKAERAFQTLPNDAEKIVEAEQKAAKSLETAHATAWALTWYMMNDEGRMNKLYAYMQELKKLPRDVEYDADVLAASFARAFGIVDDNPNNPLRTDITGAQGIGAAWFSEMPATRLEPLVVETIIRYELFPRKNKKKN